MDNNTIKDQEESMSFNDIKMQLEEEVKMQNSFKRKEVYLINQYERRQKALTQTITAYAKHKNIKLNTTANIPPSIDQTLETLLKEVGVTPDLVNV